MLPEAVLELIESTLVSGYHGTLEIKIENGKITYVNKQQGFIISKK